MPTRDAKGVPTRKEVGARGESYSRLFTTMSSTTIDLTVNCECKIDLLPVDARFLRSTVLRRHINIF